MTRLFIPIAACFFLSLCNCQVNAKTFIDLSKNTTDNSNAAKLYEASRRRLLEAKALKVVVDTKYVFTSVVQSDQQDLTKPRERPKVTKKETTTIKGTMILAADNRVRADLVGEGFRKDKVRLVMVCYGKRRRTTGGGISKTRSVNKDYARSIRQSIARGGVAMVILQKIERNLPDKYRPSDFKLGSKEKLGDRLAQILTFKLSNKLEDYSVTVWIDLETKLPLKRQMSVVGQGRTARITETTSFTINPTVDDAAFGFVD